MIDRMMPKWRALWVERSAEDEPRASGTSWYRPHPMLHPELHDLTHPCFGYSNPFPEFGMDAEMHDGSWVASNADNRVVIPFAALGWASAPAMRAIRIVLVYATRDPGEQHWRLAEAVIRVNEKREATEKERRALGEAIHEAARELAKRLGWDAEGLAKLRLWTAAEVGTELGFPHPFKAEFNQAHHDVLFFDLDAATRANVTPAQFTERLVQTRFGRRVDADTLDLAGSYQKVADLLDDWCKAGELGKNGEGLAKGFRKPSLYEEKLEEMFVQPNGPSRVANSPTLSPLFWAIGSAFWLDKVGPNLRKEAKKEAEIEQRQRRAALLPKTHSQLGNVFVSARFEGENIVSDAGQLPLVVVSSIPSAALGVLASATAQRAFRWIVRTASVGDVHEPYVRIPGADGVTVTRLERGVEIVIDGGYQGWTDVLGLKSKRDETYLRDTLDVLSGVHLREMLPGLRGGGTLINWSERGDAARGGGRRRLVFSVHPILCPGVAKIALESGEDATLVHVLPFPSIPDDFERGPTAAALGRLDWLAAQLFARHRRSAAKEGSLVVDWRELGKKAGATPKAVDAALALWCNGPKRRWDALAGGRFMYAAGGEPEAAAAREFILQGAALSEKRAAQGRRGGKSQRTKRRRSPP